MRFRHWRYIFACAFLINILLIYLFWWIQNNLSEQNGGKNENHVSQVQFVFPENFHHSATSDKQPVNLDSVTIILREYEDFDNDIQKTVLNIRNVLKNNTILFWADKIPYPPVHFPHISNFRSILLHPYPEQEATHISSEYYIKTPYVMFIPDGIRITSSSQILEMLSRLRTDPSSLIIAPVAGENSWCYKMNIKIKEWTIKNSHTKDARNCNIFGGTHVVLLQSKLFFNISYPFTRPFPYSLFIQAVIRQWKVHFLDGIKFQRGKTLFLDAHKRWKRSSLHSQRLLSLYRKFGIKKVIQPTGDIEWYGCNKHTSRCFGTVVDDVPEYLYEDRWTPPCCLEALRKTARHTLQALHQSNVRHWLEGGSLLGAARKGDIIPWDYDVDIGIYQEDIVKSKQLTSALKQSFEDEKGFVWEKATEGDFFRVQYSKSNHMHVDIFPFYSKAGIMTKNTWFKTHPQDREFPEHFLRPLTTINFIGVKASAPNNIRDFLELKFGEGVIENPRYPPKLQFINVTNN